MVGVARLRIDPERSRVVIEASSSVHPIHSEATGLEGWVDVDAGAAHLALPVDRLRSGNPLEERELKRRIDARRFPSIDGDLSALTPADDAGRYVASGDVTFRGVRRTYEEEIAVEPLDGGGVRIRGRAVFDVRDFGMEPPRILLLRVHPDVTVAIDVVAVPDEAG
jgi:polyisoprenoid-binding protein YceI